MITTSDGKALITVSSMTEAMRIAECMVATGSPVELRPHDDTVIDVISPDRIGLIHVYVNMDVPTLEIHWRRTSADGVVDAAEKDDPHAFPALYKRVGFDLEWLADFADAEAVADVLGGVGYHLLDEAEQEVENAE